MPKILVLIPARYASSRFPAKPLVKIAGLSMIERVYLNAATSGHEVAVVTDHDLIEAEVKRFGGRVFRVDDDVPSGSERIGICLERFFQDQKIDLVVNVQGDEPLLKGEELKKLSDFHLRSAFDVATLIRGRSVKDEDFHNPNVVKVAYSEKTNACLYFSRASIPFDRDGKNLKIWFQHIGVYSYRPEALIKMIKLPVSHHETIEKLEQLRLLDHGLTIGAVETSLPLQGVDVPDDVKKVEDMLNETI